MLELCEKLRLAGTAAPLGFAATSGTQELAPRRKDPRRSPPPDMARSNDPRARLHLYLETNTALKNGYYELQGTVLHG